MHIHSKASEYKEREGYVADSNIDNIDVLLKNVEDNKVNMISITDHNRFDYELYKKIKSVINKPPYEDIKNILPGVEFDVMLEESSTTSCHIICIFDDCNDKKIENIQSKINEVRILESESDYYKLEEF